MRNRYGFVPKRYMQPDRYSLNFNLWAAEYDIAGQTYFLIMEPPLKYFSNPLDFWNGKTDASWIGVYTHFKREEHSPLLFLTQFNTIRDAVAFLEKIKEKETVYD